MNVSAWLERVWESLSGDARVGVSLLHSTRKRLLTFTALLTFVVALVWVTLAGVALMVERPLMALACGVVPFLFLTFPYLVLKTRVDFDAITLGYLATLYLAVTMTAVFVGGAVSTTSFFLMLIPLLATLLMGIRTGLVWVAIVALTYSAMHVWRGQLAPPAFPMAGVWPNDWLAAAEVSLWNAVMMTLLALAASLSVANFRAVVSRSSALLVDAAGKTQDAVEARAVAETVNRLRADFIANVSHELRTPLNAIIGYSELLIETAGERGDEAGASDNRRVLEAAAKLRAMVNDIMKLSAIDAGRVKLEIDEVEVEALARDAIAALAPALQASASRIELQCEGLAPWRTDGAKLDFCLRTLLQHTVAHSHQSVIALRITMSGDRTDTTLCLEIDDAHTRLDAAAVRYVFEPFAQAEEAGGAGFDGPNLAMALCRRFARLLGGDVTADCLAEGGLHFQLTVPAEVSGQRSVAA